MLKAEYPMHVYHVRRDAKLAGLAIVVEDRVIPVPFIGAKGFCPAGILVEDAEIQQALLVELQKKLRRHMLYLEIYEPDTGSALEYPAKWRRDFHINYVIDLTQGIGEVRKNYSRAIRRNLRRAELEQPRWRLVTTVQELRTVHRLLCSTSQRVHAPALPWKLLRTVFNQLGPRTGCRCYVAEVPDGVGGWITINTRIELVYGDRAIDWYTGSVEQYADTQIGTWMVDRILADLVRCGVRCFDFGGAGREGGDYGPAEFKRRFGGQQISISRYQYRFHPHLLAIARMLYRVIRRSGGTGNREVTT